MKKKPVSVEQTLFLDAGNSRVKAAAYIDGRWQDVFRASYQAEELEVLLRNMGDIYHRIVLVSVNKAFNRKSLQDYFNRSRTISGDTPDIVAVEYPMIPATSIRYRSPGTLGLDRYMACLGAWNLSGGDVIVTDAGTACTIDVMIRPGIYLGGVIMPGLGMMISALADGADGLFTVESELPQVWPPDTTRRALQAGTAGTFLAAWNSHVSRGLSVYPESRIWVTGGDAHFIRENTTLSVNLHEYLVFEGMKSWLWDWINRQALSSNRQH